ncbi:MAG: hypothetical protein K6L75_02910 [Cellvibrionaceae bacterium]
MNYESLLEKASKEFDSFSLVWRDEFEFDDHCIKIEKQLSGHLISEERTDEWPGTKIFGALATVRHYMVNPDSIKVLKQANSFKDWLSPKYPEDLAFYKSGEVVYASIAHENDEWQ